MVNYNTCKFLFDENKGKNFIIYTNVACGRGINGVSYQKYVGLAEYKGDGNGERTTIKEMLGVGLLLSRQYNRHDEEYKSGTFTTFLPYENIVTIDFLETDIRVPNGMFIPAKVQD